MKKINIKNYVLLTLVLFTSFFAFYGKVEAKDTYIVSNGQQLIISSNWFNFTTTSLDDVCKIDGHNASENGIESRWNVTKFQYEIKAKNTKPGIYNLDCYVKGHATTKKSISLIISGTVDVDGSEWKSIKTIFNEKIVGSYSDFLLSLEDISVLTSENVISSSDSKGNVNYKLTDGKNDGKVEIFIEPKGNKQKLGKTSVFVVNLKNNGEGGSANTGDNDITLQVNETKKIDVEGTTILNNTCNSIATISNLNGLRAKGIKAGKCFITVLSRDNRMVTVNILVAGTTSSNENTKNVSLQVNETKKIDVEGTTILNNTCNGIATISTQSGLQATGIKEGKCSIAVQTWDNKQVNVNIIVNKKNTITDPTEIHVKVGESISVPFNSGVGITSIEYANSSCNNIAKSQVEGTNLKVSGLNVGSCVVTLKTWNNNYIDVKVTVEKSVSNNTPIIKPSTNNSNSGGSGSGTTSGSLNDKGLCGIYKVGPNSDYSNSSRNTVIAKYAVHSGSSTSDSNSIVKIGSGPYGDRYYAKLTIGKSLEVDKSIIQDYNGILSPCTINGVSAVKTETTSDGKLKIIVDSNLEAGGVCNFGIKIRNNESATIIVEITPDSNIGSKQHSLYLYQATDTCSNNKYTAICYDPIRKSPNNADYKPVAYVNPFDDIDAFEIAEKANSAQIEAFALSMIQNHYTDIVASKNEKGAIGRIATQIALRTYIFGNTQSILEKVDQKKELSEKELYYRKLYCNWVKNNSNYFKNSGVNVSECMNVEAATWSGKYFYNANLSSASEALGKAETYWKESTVISLKSCGNSNKNCKEVTGLKNVGFNVNIDYSKKMCSPTGNSNEKEFIITGSITGLDGYNQDIKIGTDDYSPIITLKSVDCPDGFVCEVYVDGQKINLGVDNNLKGFTKSKVELKVVIKGDICNLPESFDPSKNMLIFESMHPYDWHNVVTISPVSTSENLQRMFIIKEPGSIITKVNMFGNIKTEALKVTCGCNVSECSKPEYDPASSSFDEEAFKNSKCCLNPETQGQIDKVKANGGSAAYCGSCDDIKWSVYCAPTDNELNYYIKEGYKTDGTLDYKTCVIERGKDKADNSYLEKSVSYSGTSLCKIYCSEVWDLKLPGYKQNVYAGTGFDISIEKISGKRTCFTDQINVSGFETLLKAANQNIIDAYNNYSYANALVEGFKKGTSSTSSSSNRITVDEVEKCFKNDKGDTECNSTCLAPAGKTCDNNTKRVSKTCSNSISYTSLTSVSVSYINYDSNLNSNSYKTSSNTYGSVEFAYNSCDGTTISPEDAFLKAIGASSIDSYLSSKINAINTALDERNSLIKTYSSCSNWADSTNTNSIKFNFDPEISYVIADNEIMNKIENNKFEVKGSTAPKEYSSYFDENVIKNPNFQKTYAGGANKSYEKKYSMPKINTNNGNVGSLSKTEVKLPNNYYVRKDMENSASYEISGRFYVENMTGAISWKETGSTANNNETEFLGNKWVEYYKTNGEILPISFTLPKGKYEYQLKFANIGQYNGTNNTGRLIGGNDVLKNGTNSVLKEYLGKSNIVTGESCFFEVEEGNCHCCGKDVDVTVVSLQDCPSGKCKVTDTRPGGYLSNNANLSYFARAVTLNDLNPNNRNLGTNWTDAKGNASLNEIQTNGYNIYNGTPDLTITLTPSGIAAIKKSGSTYDSSNILCNSEGVNCLSKYLDNLNSINGVTVENRTNSFTSFKTSSRELSWK